MSCKPRIDYVLIAGDPHYRLVCDTHGVIKEWNSSPLSSSNYLVVAMLAAWGKHAVKHAVVVGSHTETTSVLEELPDHLK